MIKRVISPIRFYICSKCGNIPEEEVKHFMCPMCGSEVLTHKKCGEKVGFTTFGEFTKIY